MRSYFGRTDRYGDVKIRVQAIKMMSQTGKASSYNPIPESKSRVRVEPYRICLNCRFVSVQNRLDIARGWYVMIEVNI